MKNRWSLFALACMVILASACAGHAPRQTFEGNDLASSWEARYLDTWGDSGV